MRLLLALTFLVAVALAQQSFTPPFYRTLEFHQPMFSGNDVYILQSLLNRDPAVTPNITVDGYFGRDTQTAVKQFQGAHSLTADGTAGEATCNALLQYHLADKYTDDLRFPLPAGYKYKVYVPVYSNRSIETNATLFDSKGKAWLVFKTHTHGQNDGNGNALNQLSGSGSTPTGLSSFDLNTPEPDPVDYGPYPINRAVTGLAGNAQIVISDIRDGILMHTGEWPNWNPNMEMPNSHGCIHAHPDAIQQVWKILVNDLGVVLHNNTFGKLPYPYTPQGLLSVVQLD